MLNEENEYPISRIIIGVACALILFSVLCALAWVKCMTSSKEDSEPAEYLLATSNES